ncbi:MAG: outer membrane beta-barrel protein [Rhodomicrobium sp.]
MKRLGTGLLVLILASASAFPAGAADWFRSGEAASSNKDGLFIPVVTWTGSYAGVSAGGGLSQESNQLAFPGFGGLQPSGGFGGVQLGFNWQGGFGFSPLVLGIEADIQVSAIEDEGRDIAGNIFRSRLEDFGTVRGRMGYAMDCTLFYFTGGFAYGSVKHEASFGGSPDFIVNTTATGYVLGGGVEYRFNPAVSIKGEYQYINLGKNEPEDPIAGSYSAYGGTVRDDAFHTLRVGFNWYPFPVYEALR